MQITQTTNISTSMGYSTAASGRALSYDSAYATTAVANPTVTSELLRTEASFASLLWPPVVGPP